jgi:hypothetical protein
MHRQQTPTTDVAFIDGYSVKPYTISLQGVVTFTDGSYQVTPNQIQCEAYGYVYDQARGVCMAYRPLNNLVTQFQNTENKIEGARNLARVGTQNTHILGEKNTVQGDARNNRITGVSNEIANGVNNTNVLGVLGNATTSNSLIIGGNDLSSSLGERQIIRLMYGKQTTNASSANALLNNTTASFFVIPDNSIIYFHADTLAVRTGGSSGDGAVGDYASYVERGVVINKSGTCTIQRERDTIKTSGDVTNWRVLANVSGTNLNITVRGQTDMTLEWALNINITQIQTGVSL